MEQSNHLLSRLSFGTLCLYIIFSYIAYEGILSPMWGSLSLYLCIFTTVAVSILTKSFHVTNYTSWYACFILLALCSCLWAKDLDASTLVVMTTTLVVTLCLILNLHSLKDVESLTKIYVLAGVILGILLYVSGVLENILVSMSLGEEERLGSEVFGNANILSEMLMVSAMYSSWLMIYSDSRVTKLVSLASFVFILIMMVLSGGRKTIIAVIVATIWFLLSKQHTIKKRIKSIILTIALIYACLYAVQYIEFINIAIGDRFEGIYAILLGQESDVSGDDIRLKMIDAGLSGWVDSPLIGHGVDSFKYLNQNVTGHLYYSHNNFVEILYNFGILGFVLYYGFIARLTYRIIKIPKCNKNITSFRSLAMGLIIVFLIRDIGGISYYSTLPQLLLCVSFVIYLLLKKCQNENTTTWCHNGQ